MQHTIIVSYKKYLLLHDLQELLGVRVDFTNYVTIWHIWNKTAPQSVFCCSGHQSSTAQRKLALDTKQYFVHDQFFAG